MYVGAMSERDHRTTTAPCRPSPARDDGL